MILSSYLRTSLATTWCVLVYAITLGRVNTLEGKVSQGVFRNWAGNYRYQPRQYALPTTESEIVDLVRGAERVRVFGSGHSFNEGVVVDGTLISLDRYAGVVWQDLEAGRVAFKAGTRVRDVISTLHQLGLAFSGLPSHDSQSIGGILSTDVHGTGQNWGFVSDNVVRLKIINGNGDVCECGPEDDLFRSAVGGVGAAGIIVEVIVEAEARFNIEQRVAVKEVEWIWENLDELLRKNDHMSLYLFPFAEKCQLSTWNRTAAPQSTLGPLREFLTIAFDSLMGTWIGNLAAYLGILPQISKLVFRIRKGSNLVLESYEGFNRSIYYPHQEYEFSIPEADTRAACERFIKLYEAMYADGLPYLLVEVRFTPAGHHQTLIGPGKTTHCTWIDLVCNDTEGYEAYYQASTPVVKELQGRPHLGKYCAGWDSADLDRLYGADLVRFREIVAQNDPDGRFANAFTERLCLPNSAS